MANHRLNDSPSPTQGKGDRHEFELASRNLARFHHAPSSPTQFKIQDKPQWNPANIARLQLSRQGVKRQPPALFKSSPPKRGTHKRDAQAPSRGTGILPAPQYFSAGADDPAAPGSPAVLHYGQSGEVLRPHHSETVSSITSPKPLSILELRRLSRRQKSSVSPRPSPELPSISELRELRRLRNEPSVPDLIESAHVIANSPTNPATANSQWQTPNSWFLFPPEIRNMIYDHLVQLPDSKTLYRGLRSRLSTYSLASDINLANLHRGESVLLHNLVASDLTFQTPTILLLSRAITAECLPILRSRTLVISHLPPWLPGHSQPLPLTHFIGRRTLQNIRHIDLRISLGAGGTSLVNPLRSGWAWKGVVEDLLAVLMEDNCFESFRVLMRMCETADSFDLDRLVWKKEKKIFHGLVKKVIKLRQQNPNIYRSKTVEMDFWHVYEKMARRLLFDESTMSLKMEEGGGEIRDYPDSEMWPGCIMEFC